MKLTVQINVNWPALMPQIAECIQDILNFGYTLREIATILEDRYNWTENAIFRRQEFNYENARFTLTQLCNMVEMLAGSDTEFADELRNRVKGLLMEVAA